MLDSCRCAAHAPLASTGWCCCYRTGWNGVSRRSRASKLQDTHACCATCARPASLKALWRLGSQPVHTPPLRQTSSTICDCSMNMVSLEDLTFLCSRTTAALAGLTRPCHHMQHSSSARATRLSREPALHPLLLSLILQQCHRQLQLLLHRCWA